MNKYKVIMPKKTNYTEAIIDSLGKENICFLEKGSNIQEIERLAETLTKEQNIILYNLTKENDIILNMLPKKMKKYIILEYSVSELSDPDKLNELLLMMKYITMGMLTDIYCLDHVTYQLFKDKYNAKYLQLDIKTSEETSGTSIGVLAEPNNHYASTVNELSAITLTDFKKVKLVKPMKVVRKFAKKFGLKVIKTKGMYDTMSHNEINLYINFTSTSYQFILKSMDMGIPCIVGNTDFFDKNEKLKQFLVVKSDDDINEIKEKILNVKKHKKEILVEYKNFRKKYSDAARKNIEEFKEIFR